MRPDSMLEVGEQTLFLLRESLPRRLPGDAQRFADSGLGYLSLAKRRDVLSKHIFGLAKLVGGGHQGLEEIIRLERVQSGKRRNRLAIEDAVAQLDAIVADKDGGTRNEFLELLVVFSAERAIEHLAFDHSRKPRVKDYLTDAGCQEVINAARSCSVSVQPNP